MPTPEQKSRETIDALLVAAGWSVQNYRDLDLSHPGVAVREVPLTTGQCDYLLVANRRPIGVIEAKKEGSTLSHVALQSAHYGRSLPEFLANLLPETLANLPFAYESTGLETYFRDERDPEPRSRRVFAFHKPETLVKWLDEPDTLRARLASFPISQPLVTRGLRDCQIEAIAGLEQSLAKDMPRALIQMATGAGKTFTACSFAYRLIRHAKAKRILFLVDRASLGKQTRDEFANYETPDTGRKFTELYNVQHLNSNHLDDAARVTICTIQRLYSMLRGEELTEEGDELSAYEISAADGRPKDVAYNPSVPIEAFDFIVTDECHRSIYNLWRQVLEYFDAHLIGLTATPSKQTIGFFHQNLVMEYNHERAVADGVNVGYDVYRIKTAVTDKGSTVEKGLYVDKRHRETRKVRWERLDEDLTYDPKALDRSVVVPSQIRTVLQAFRDALPELFPGRAMVPKTLIFAKDDSHAEDIVRLCREVFGRGNEFCQKITYNAYVPGTTRKANTENLIQEFRLSPQFRIAVTVDLIATGTDIKPLECLLFLRDVRSRVYFEQMKGRGTRTLSPTDLQAVSGADARAKTHFVIVDAVGVCESDKTDSRPLEKQPSVAMPQLLLGVALGKRDEDSLTTLASRLARLDRQVSPAQRQELADLAGGKTLAELSRELLRAVDPDAPNREERVATACAPFDKPALRDAIVRVKRDAEQTIDTVTVDRVEFQGFDAAAKERAQSLTRSFREYIEAHKAEIDALQILYSRPHRQRLTEPLLKDLEGKLRAENAAWNEETLWRAFETAAPGKVKGRSQVDRFADLVPLVKFALERQPVLEPFADSVRERFEAWVAEKAAAGKPFSPDQLAWLELIRDHVATSLSIEPEDFEYAPFSQRGGLGRAHQLFGEGLEGLLEELNEVLAA